MGLTRLVVEGTGGNAPAYASTAKRGLPATAGLGVQDYALGDAGYRTGARFDRPIRKVEILV